jgi:hypothetical protein
VPADPPGWLVTTAWHRAVDRLRREANGREKPAALMPAEPEADGLAALLELHEARAATRFGADGSSSAPPGRSSRPVPLLPPGVDLVGQAGLRGGAEPERLVPGDDQRVAHREAPLDRIFP